MKGTLTTAALVIAATLVAAVSRRRAPSEVLPGANPTRAEYVAEVDPICQKNTDSNKPILKSAPAQREGRQAAPGRQELHQRLRQLRQVAEIDRSGPPPGGRLGPRSKSGSAS